jgi:hypothetical protein
VALIIEDADAAQVIPHLHRERQLSQYRMRGFIIGKACLKSAPAPFDFHLCL